MPLVRIEEETISLEVLGRAGLVGHPHPSTPRHTAPRPTSSAGPPTGRIRCCFQSEKAYPAPRPPHPAPSSNLLRERPRRPGRVPCTAPPRAMDGSTTPSPPLPPALHIIRTCVLACVRAFVCVCGLGRAELHFQFQWSGTQAFLGSDSGLTHPRNYQG